MKKLSCVLLLFVLAILAQAQPSSPADTTTSVSAPTFDVVVVGGGPAGIGAALAAWRCCDPREVPLELVRQKLSTLGHIVPERPSVAASRWP